MKSVQVRTAKKGDVVKLTNGSHAGEKGRFVKAKNLGTTNCVITVELECGKRTVANGYVQYVRKAN